MASNEQAVQLHGGRVERAAAKLCRWLYHKRADYLIGALLISLVVAGRECGRNTIDIGPVFCDLGVTSAALHWMAGVLACFANCLYACNLTDLLTASRAGKQCLFE